MSRFTKKFDSIYERHAPGVPVLYLRSLAGWESSSNPKSGAASAHVGLLQIGGGALKDYNAAKGTTHKKSKLVDPVFNVKVFYNAYKMHLRVFRRLVNKRPVLYRNFREDWGNKEFVFFVTAAHNSGIGVLNKAARMKPRLLEPVRVAPLTRNDVFALGRRDGNKKMKWLLRIAKQAWQTKVVATYFGFLKGKKEGFKLKETKGGIGGGTLLILAVIAWALSKKRGR